MNTETWDHPESQVEMVLLHLMVKKVCAKFGEPILSSDFFHFKLLLCIFIGAKGDMGWPGFAGPKGIRGK